MLYKNSSTVLLFFACCLFPPTGVAENLFPERPQLLYLLHEKQFLQIEQLITDYQLSFEQETGNEARIFYSMETFANADPDLKPLLEQWIKERPDSFVPYLVRGYYQFSLAKAMRESRLRSQTSLQDFEEVEHYLELAADDLRQVIGINPRVTTAYVLAINMLASMQEHEFKKQAYTEALSEIPHSFLIKKTYYSSLESRHGIGNDELENFAKEINKAVIDNPELKILLGYQDYFQGKALSNRGEYEQAKTYFDIAVDKGADHLIYLHRGINYYWMNDYQSALNDFNHALELWPQDPDILYWRGKTLRHLQRNEDALDDFNLAVQLNPYDQYTLMARASLLRQSGNYEQAIEDYANALYYNASAAEIWFERGMHYFNERKEFALAADDLQQATQLNPDKVEYWYYYAAVLHYLGDCNIVKPIKNYLELCASGRECNSKEHEWILFAQNWLQEKQRCPENIPVADI